ncbi:MAG: NAD(P)H-quinone oxidoreductase [Sphingomonadaceae bacterium]
MKRGHRMGAIVPETMQAIGLDEPGGPEVLTLKTLEVPRPGPEQVLIRVSHAGVNRPDVIQRQGHYPPPPGASPIPGLEISGEIVALGENTNPALIGQPMCALVTGGGYAQYCVAHEGHCLPVPEGLDMAEAAAMPETVFTVWHNLFERGWACEGETLLVHGGTSGIGTMAIMLGKSFGLTVIVTCGSEEKCAEARKIGADHAINYKTRDFVEEVRLLTGGKGLHIVLDMVSGDYVPRNLACLGEDGRHVTIALLGGAMTDINMGHVMRKRLTLTGSTLRARPDTFKTLLAEEIAVSVWPLVEEGKLRPVMDRSFPLAQAGEAHARMEAGEHIGKIVLDMNI